MAISAGGYQTCALTTGGGVKCWGDNHWGELGDGTTTDRYTPVNVSGLTSGVKAISAGGRGTCEPGCIQEEHTCALTTGGGVNCWGDNEYGQLGDGTTKERHKPVNVSGLTSSVTAISDGGSHACALTASGGVKCWGSNFSGGLGDGTTTDRHIPVDVSGLSSGVAEVSAGVGHTCAITGSGAVKCWGYNRDGELGNGTTVDRHTPVNVSGLTSGVMAISAGGYHTCALTTGSGVRCWGWNVTGQLGDGTTTDRHTSVNVSGLTSGVTMISGGSIHTCALMTDRGVKCWGDNLAGQVGDGTTKERRKPVDVVGLTPGVRSPSISKLSPTKGARGTKVVVRGRYLKGATVVYFGNRSAQFRVVGATKLTTRVPLRARTAKVSVVTAGGVAMSKKSFKVT